MSSGTSSLTLCVSVDLWPTTNLTHGNFIHLHISFESKRKSILGTSTCSAQCQQILSAHLYLARKKGGSNDSQVIALLWEVKSPSSCPRVGDSPKQHSSGWQRQRGWKGREGSVWMYTSQACAQVHTMCEQMRKRLHFLFANGNLVSWGCLSATGPIHSKGEISGSLARCSSLGHF